MLRPSTHKLTTEHLTTTSCLIHSENILPTYTCMKFPHLSGSLFSECIKQLVVVKCSVVSWYIDGLNNIQIYQTSFLLCYGKAVNLEHVRTLEWSEKQRNATSIKWDIPKLDTVLLHSNWGNLRRKYLSNISTDLNALRCGSKACIKDLGKLGHHFPRATSAKILAACTCVCCRRWRNLF